MSWEPLTWEASYAIALALRQRYPEVRLEDVSLEQLRRWVLALPDFDDDPALANEEVLLAILREWLEILWEEAAQGGPISAA